MPFFFKQWGGFQKSKAGRKLDGQTYDEMPARVELPVLNPRQRAEVIAEVNASYPTNAPAPQPTASS